MKLKYFSEQTLPKAMGGWGKSATAKVSFSKGGLISINKGGVTLLGLKPGDKITIAQDEEDPANWYLFKDKDHGFELRCKDPEKPDALILSHRRLQQMVCESCEISADQAQTFLIAGQPTVLKGDKTQYWGLLQKATV